jgi:YVTN family beta-propeller protein
MFRGTLKLTLELLCNWRKAFFAFLILPGCFLFSCKKADKPVLNTSNNNTPPPSGKYTDGVWIVDEGTYSFGNASIDFYHKDKGTDELNVFEAVQGKPLGDVLQSMAYINGRYYLVVNNGQRIEVTDENMKSLGTITNLTSPRYVLSISGQKMYVTDLYARGIWIVNPQSLKVSGTIPYYSGADSTIKGWTEQMQLINNEAFVCGVESGQIIVINTATDKIIDSIPVGKEPQWMATDKENRLWVLCNGTIEKQYSRLYRIDPGSRKILQAFSFPDKNIGVSQLKMNAAGDSLYYIARDVYKMSIQSSSLPSSPYIISGNRSFYGIGVDPYDNTLYVSDAVDYVQAGKVYHYAQNGSLINSFSCGVQGSDFLFVK